VLHGGENKNIVAILHYDITYILLIYMQFTRMKSFSYESPECSSVIAQHIGLLLSSAFYDAGGEAEAEAAGFCDIICN